MARAKSGMAPRRRYRVLTGISYPTDTEIVRRIQAGESIPYEERGLKEVRAGRVVKDIPAVSVPWLLEQGLIEEVVADDAQG